VIKPTNRLALLAAGIGLAASCFRAEAFDLSNAGWKPPVKSGNNNKPTTYQKQRAKKKAAHKARMAQKGRK